MQLEPNTVYHVGRRLAIWNPTAPVRRRLWPRMLAAAEKGALPLCKWGARRGVMAHRSLRLRWTPAVGNELFVSQPVPSGTVLLSVPLDSTLITVKDRRATSNCGYESAIDELTQTLCRVLEESGHPLQPYVTFLYDTYNWDDDENGTSTAVDEALAGNRPRGMGVPNAPFITRSQLRTAKGRATLQRYQRVLKQLRQGLPRFASLHADWALSMALSRSRSDGSFDGELFMAPFVDMCNFSVRPTAETVLDSIGEGRVCVKGYLQVRPGIHVRTTQPLAKGEAVTLQYLDQPTVLDDAARDMWLLRYGFEYPEMST